MNPTQRPTQNGIGDIPRRLLRSVGHEMQQPIYAIQNFAFAAREHLRVGRSDQVAEMLAMIQRQVMRAREYGDCLRQFAADVRPANQPTDVHVVIRDCSEVVQLLADDARASIQLSLHATSTSVMADQVPLRQVLLHLVRNATDSLALNDARPRCLSIATQNDHANVYVSVTDTGGGIATADRQRIFEPYFSTKELGIGLGLTYCQAVINAYGGEIQLATNHPGQVTFEVRLPIAASAAT